MARKMLTAVAATLLVMTGTGTLTATAASAKVTQRANTTTTSTTTWTYKKLSSPARVVVLDGSATPVATFTNGARTVAVRGATRTLTEPSTTAATVSHSTWVRLLPAPFSGTVDTAWLQRAVADTSPDVLAVAGQYVTDAPTVYAADATVLADDADYGPLQADGTREEGSDFNDYLQVPWTYGTRVDAPETDQRGALDCSGYVRMVLGYRLGLPMTLDPDGTRLPRRAVQMLASAPGVVTIPDTGKVPTATSKLQPGDLLFFDGSTDDGTLVDHVGIYLGVDSAGAHRFVSSRKTVNGPTLGDVGGKSVVSGTGYYAQAWRAARRV